jgi:hypothetical protein
MKIIVAFIIVVLTAVVVWAFMKARRSTPTRVLVCMIGPDNELETLAAIDADIYHWHYSDVTLTSCATAGQFPTVLRQGRYRIVHLLLRIDAQGEVSGTGIRTILETCRRNGGKMLILANDHDADTYIKWVNVTGVNLVMTVERKGDRFPVFWDGLLDRLTKGMTMPQAWVDLVPQVEGPHQADEPRCIFAAGAGGESFR